MSQRPHNCPGSCPSANYANASQEKVKVNPPIIFLKPLNILHIAL